MCATADKLVIKPYLVARKCISRKSPLVITYRTAAYSIIPHGLRGCATALWRDYCIVQATDVLGITSILACCIGCIAGNLVHG